MFDASKQKLASPVQIKRKVHLFLKVNNLCMHTLSVKLRQKVELLQSKRFWKAKEDQVPTTIHLLYTSVMKTCFQKTVLKPLCFTIKHLGLYSLALKAVTNSHVTLLWKGHRKKKICLEFVLARQINILSHNSAALLTKRVIVFPLMPSPPLSDREQVAKVLRSQGS